MNNFQMINRAKQYKGTTCPQCKAYCRISPSEPYCNAFVSYIYYLSGNKEKYCDGLKETYCPHSVKWCRDHLAEIPPFMVMPGDVVYFDFNHNGTPDHIGLAESRKDAVSLYTIEGNTSPGGTVQVKERELKDIFGIYRTHFKPKLDKANKLLTVDGYFGYETIAALQRYLNIKADGIFGLITAKALQKKIGITADGKIGPKTIKALQKYLKIKEDGLMGPETVKALQSYLNNEKEKEKKPKENEKENKEKTKGQKIGEKAHQLAYKNSTSKANYPEGKPTEDFKKALNEVYPEHTKWGKAPSVGASCDVFTGTSIRASGADPKFPRGLDEQWKHLKNSEKWYEIENDIKNLKNGDIITYQRTDGGGHICIYYEGKIKEAAYERYYGKTNAATKTRLKKTGKKWVKIYRIKNK